eukprot:CAMPEP_0206488744 /NCGR_PEP_ID=MMETSP0324_2-20121206/42645_1 /ASSEMBLY_ACC=CAM_ASM_000836 /TAXON_ID=2866 /ORGANISM="Crypthecodinium cohnii, Strain Seligo" /LENGTH=480 /DNA_ID=CAMNT_0053967927 /DNA_START=296 /DNA_END=1735 /DNA_ORIENTATION=-
MGSKWLDGACMAVTFDAPGTVKTPYLEGVVGGWEPGNRAAKPTENGAESHEDFAMGMLHLFSLLHALALQHVRGDSELENLQSFEIHRDTSECAISNPPSAVFRDLPERPRTFVSTTIPPGWTRHKFDKVYRITRLEIIGKLTPQERLALENDQNGRPIPTDARVTMVEGWIMRRLIARQKHEKSDSTITSPPILSRLYQVISDGCIGFGQASKFTDTPFPFPYHNLMQVFLWVYVFSVPFLVNAWVKALEMRCTMSFLAVWCYFSLHQVGNNLEDPFLPYDHNDLALQTIQHSYNAKLLSFAPVPPVAKSVGNTISLARTLEGQDSPLVKPATLGRPEDATPPTSPIPHAPQPPPGPAPGAAYIPGSSGLQVLDEHRETRRKQDSTSSSIPAEAKSVVPTQPVKDQKAESKLQNDPSLQALQLGSHSASALTSVVNDSLLELASAQTRCLQLVGVVEGALKQSQTQGLSSPVAPPLPGA